MKEWLLEAAGRRPSSGDRGRRRCDKGSGTVADHQQHQRGARGRCSSGPAADDNAAGLQRRTAAAGDPNDAAAGGSSRATRRRGTAAPEIADRRSRTAGAAAAIARTAAEAVWLWRTEADDHAAAVRRDSGQWRRLRLLRRRGFGCDYGNDAISAVASAW
ncbi:hypothetical protein Scep_020893 [Stephania cephalantha]|uniref:Uncharacterized protein n=1 Tax=Stephania cephalantha TaxID=152367 RepID=A0AAP0FBL3_9MAGN